MGDIFKDEARPSLSPQEIEFLERNASDIPSCPSLTTGTELLSTDEVIYQGFYRGSNVRVRPVLLSGATEQERRRAIMQFIQKLRFLRNKQHPNIIPIQGFHTSTSEPILSLVSEYPTSIPVIQYLDANPSHNRHQCCVEIAKGLDYVHMKSIIHGAVRGSNVIVKPDGSCCLGEFSSEERPAANILLQYANWLAPELIDVNLYRKLLVDDYRHDGYTGQYKLASDVFALACTAIEMYTNSPPEPVRIDWSKSPDLPTLAKAPRVSSPVESEKIPPNVMQTLNMMMHYIPYQRPNSGKVVDWLEDPTMRKVFRTAPVLAKNELWRAYQRGNI